MAKTLLGIDIGQNQLKLALVRNGRVVKTACQPMPENLLREGRIVSQESMSDLLKEILKANGMKAAKAAYIMPAESVYIKNVQMPLMTIEQLEYNLPFEFHDYITGEARDYVFDYAVLSGEENKASGKTAEKNGKNRRSGRKKVLEQESGSEEESESVLELMAVAADRSALESIQQILHRLGMKLEVAAPTVSAYISLIRLQHEKLISNMAGDEFGILDLGFGAVRLYMFHGDRHVAVRVLETGLSSLDIAVADAYSVDVHLAHTYLMTNFENCQERPECTAAYENIAVELMRAMNFYHFSNPGSNLADIWLCGGGAVIRPLVSTIQEMLNIRLHLAQELVPGGETIADCNTFVQAIGIAMS